jgi:mono/diheme cytochrome c family protein
MTIKRFKFLAIIFFGAPLLAVAMFSGTNGRVVSAMGEDPAVTFKAKCAMCHTAKAEKFFDPAKADDVLVEEILKGKKAEKPPNMPGFEAKGMTADEAKALVTLMRGLRAPAN